MTAIRVIFIWWTVFLMVELRSIQKKTDMIILNCAATKIKMNFLPVWQQSNGIDCRIYAVGFCSYILSKRVNSLNAFLNQGKVSSHLLHCLTADNLIKFSEDKIYQCYTQQLNLWKLMFFAVVECSGKSLKTIFVKEK